MEEVKIRENTIADLKKTIAEGEAKLKQQQNLYEAVRSDRNLYSKNLIEAQVPRARTRARAHAVHTRTHARAHTRAHTHTHARRTRSRR